MSSLFSEQGFQRLDEIVKPGLLCAFDFDGTLAPIVAQPDAARLPSDIRQRLVELSEYAPIGIITGRSVPDIKKRLDFTPVYLVGNHGLEGVPGWERRSKHYEALCRTWKQKIAAALQDQGTFDPGIQIEDKRYSLSLHYRMARDHARAESHLNELISTLSPPPRVTAGKCVFNLLPKSGADKGKAFEALMRISGAGSAIYVGDDVTDEDVFRLPRNDLLSVRVERTPGSAAAFFLPHRLDMFRLFDELIQRLRVSQLKTATQRTHAKNA